MIFWGLSPQNPNFLGWRWGSLLLNYPGQFGDGDSQNFGNFLGENPGKKKSKFGVGVGERILGISPNTTKDHTHIIHCK